jgi:hypothetical protein
MNDPLLDDFAELVVERHDEAIERVASAASKESRVPKGYESLRAELAELDPKALEVLLRCAVMTANDVLAGTLYTVSEFADNGEWDLRIKGKKLSDLTPGLQSELGMDDGWLRRFSRHRQRPAG